MTASRRSIIHIAFAMAASFAAAGDVAAQDAAAQAAAAQAGPAGDLAAGEARFAQSCANCHGRRGRGMASFPSLVGRTADYVADRLRTYRAGEPVGPNSALMIPMATDLTDAEVDNLAAFIATRFQ